MARMGATRLACCLVCLALVPAVAHGQENGDLIRGTTDEHDPVGIDATFDLRTLPIAPPSSPSRPDERSIRRGNVLVAVSGVQELEHRVDVRLDDGLAFVHVEQRFEHRGVHPAEIRYRLPAPRDATITRFEVCTDVGCRSGRPERDPSESVLYDQALSAQGGEDALPVGRVEATVDERGPCFVIRAGPIVPSSELRISLGWTATASIRGSVVRFELPARGSDPRAAPAHISAHSDTYGTLDARNASFSEGELVVRDAWEPFQLVAHPNPTRARGTISFVRCGPGECVRAWAWAPRMEPKATDIVLLLDASPSMLGPARGRMGPVLATFLASLPAGSSLVAFAFGARAEPIVDSWTKAEQVRLDALLAGAERDLEPATRFEAAWALAESAIARRTNRAKDVHVVWVGDGALAESEEAARAFRAAVERRIPVSHVSLVERPVVGTLRSGVERSGGVLVHVSEDADRVRHGETAPLEEALSPILSPRTSLRLALSVGGRIVRSEALRAGQELALLVERPGRARPRLRVGALPIVSLPGPREDAATPGASWIAAAPIASAPPHPTEACVLRTSASSSPGAGRGPWLVRACTPPSPPSATRDDLDGKGMPAESLLTMFRSRIVPRARGCFRRDRAGRTDYAVRTELRFELADREIVRADVAGNLAPPLRACLLRAIDSLEIPAFAGRIVVRYPLYTEREAPPPTLDLLPEVADEVDRVLRLPLLPRKRADLNPSAPSW